MTTPTKQLPAPNLESLARRVTDLPPDELVIELRGDQRRRWLRGERVHAEEYFARLPTLGDDPVAAVDLIFAEFLLGGELGERPQPPEFVARFPQFAEPLRRQFEFHAAIASAEREPAAAECSTNPNAAGDVAHNSSSPTNQHNASSISPGNELPTRIGRFEIRGRLGAGGFANVYRAYDPQLGREAALKIPHPHLLSAEHRDRFMREARAAAQLQHPNLVAVYDSGDMPGGCYIVYQLIEGRTLAAHLAAQTEHRLAPADTARIVHKLAQAAHHAHSKGVFHRDLKTANILIDTSGEPFISDFGLVRLEGDATLTATAAILGTPAYMPPEQAGGTSHLADARSDVYSLGVILYELVAGRLPFVGSPHSVLRAVIDEYPASLRSLDRAVPRDLETICFKAMAKRPADRYASAEHLAEDIGRWLAGEPILARPATTLERVVKWSRRRPAGAGLIGVSFVAAVAVVVLAIVQNQRVYEAKWRARETARSLATQGVQMLDQGDSRGLLLLVAACRTAEGQPELLESYCRVWASWQSAWAGRLHAVVGHDGEIRAAAFSPDAATIVTASRTGEFQIWDALTGRARLQPWRHNAAYGPGQQYLAFSTDGRELVTADRAGLHFVVLASGRAAARPSIELPEASFPTFSPDGRWLAAVGSDGTTILETESRAPAFLSPNRGGSLTFSPDSALLMSHRDTKSNGRVAVFAADPWRKLDQRRDRHDGTINSAAFSSDGKWIATASADDTARIWDARTGEPRGEPLRHGEDVWAVAFSADGHVLATGSFDGTARLWDAETGRPLAPPLRHDGGVMTLAFSPDRQRPLLATGSVDRTVRFWDAATGQSVGSPLQQPSSVRSVQFTSDGRRLLVVSADQSARVWNVAAAQPELHRLEHEGRVWSVAFDPTGKRLLTGLATEDERRFGATSLWDVATGEPIWGPQFVGEQALRVAISPDGAWFAMAGPLPQAVLWRLDSGEPMDDALAAVLAGKQTRSTAIDPSGSLIALCGGHECWLFDKPARTMRGAPMQHEGRVRDVAFSPDGKLLATASIEDRAIRLWDTATTTLVRGPLGHSAMVDRVMFSPDGKYFVAASSDLSAYFWDATTWQPLGARLQQPVLIEDLAFNRDSKLLATAGSDGAVRVWDVASGFPCGPAFRHEQHAQAVAFSPDSRIVASGSYDKTARLWHLPWADDPALRGSIELDSMAERTWLALGIRLGDRGGFEAVPWHEWQRLHAKWRFSDSGEANIMEHATHDLDHVPATPLHLAAP